MTKPKVLAIDTETTGVGVKDRAFGIGLCDERMNRYFFRWSPYCIDTPHSWYKLKKWMEDRDITKVFFNAIFDINKIRMMDVQGVRIKVRGRIEDVYIIARILLPHEPRHNLRALVLSQLKEEDNKTESRINTLTKGRNKVSYYELPKKLLKKHCKNDVEYTMKMFYYLKSGIKHNQVYGLEKKLIPVVIDMESIGIKVNLKLCMKKQKAYSSKIQRIENYFRKEYGIDKLSSPKQLRDLLYHKWSLHPPTVTPKGEFSTEKLALILLRDEHVDIKKIELYRKLQHSQTNYFNVLIKKSVHGIIHPRFNPMGHIDRRGIPTGRFSSNGPNLQSIKRGPEIRSLFVPRKGYFMCSHDYSQIEMRLYAYLSNDKMMKKVYGEGGNVHEIHQKTFVDPHIKGWSEEEKYMVAKHIGFEILYGMGASGMKAYLDLNEIHLTKEIVSKMIDGWKKQHPSLERMKTVLANELRKHGYITDIFGRRFYLPLWRSYVAVNYLIQGMAAGIIKTAMVEVHKKLKEKGGHILISLHDEIITEIPNNQPELVDVITDCMESIKHNAIKMKFPTEHRISHVSWGEC